jgi:2-polyprenyl-3-methyl-5-hydroxy-6-metoxy-1,4-benzoquinol methylase
VALREQPWWREYYGGRPVHGLPGTHEQASTLLKRHLPPPARVLDLGGGTGAFASRLRDEGYEVTLADLDPPEDLGVRTVRLDLNDTSSHGVLEGGAYDAVVCIEVIEHLENPIQLLRSAMRFTRDGGLLLVTTPNVVDLDSRVRFLLGGDFYLFSKAEAARGASQFAHIAILPYWLLLELLRRVGWQPLERAFIGRKPRRGWRRWVAPLLGLPLLLLGWRIPREAAWAPSTAFACVKKAVPVNS